MFETGFLVICKTKINEIVEDEVSVFSENGMNVKTKYTTDLKEAARLMIGILY